jgi:hypothetical protein
VLVSEEGSRRGWRGVRRGNHRTWRYMLRAGAAGVPPPCDAYMVVDSDASQRRDTLELATVSEDK